MGKLLEEGIHYGLEMQDYLADPGDGSSDLKLLNSSPIDYITRKSQPPEETKALTLGTLVHTMILEPDEFSMRYILQPEDWGPKNCNPGRKKWDEFKKLAKENELIPIGYEWVPYLNLLHDELKNQTTLQELLKVGKVEVTGITKLNDIRLKARTDLLVNNSLFDVKTTSSGMDDYSLARAVFDFGYHFQAVHHSWVFKMLLDTKLDFGWIFVSTGTPYPHVRILKADSLWLSYGQNDWDSAINTLATCRNQNHYPGYPTIPTVLPVPEYIERIYRG